MAYAELGKQLLELATGSAADKERAQEQLKPVLEKRFQPCIDFWQHLWRWGTEGQNIKADGSDDKTGPLLETVGTFLEQNGAVISVPTLIALVAFRQSLEELKLHPDNYDIFWRAAYKHLVPSSRTNEKGKPESAPGLLMLLRDDIGSNAKAVSSVLG